MYRCINCTPTLSFGVCGWAMEQKGWDRSSTLLSEGSCPAEGAQPASSRACNQIPDLLAAWIIFHRSSRQACRWMRGVCKTKQIRARTSLTQRQVSRGVSLESLHIVLFFLLSLTFISWNLFLLYCCAGSNSSVLLDQNTYEWFWLTWHVCVRTADCLCHVKSS
jgi:hypothetical protein